MSSRDSNPAPSARKPIRIGLSCWRWEWGRYRSLLRLAQSVGVTLELRQTCHGLRRDIEGEVSGRNVDRFIAEFARNS
jgi:hypothetical protein